jgi:predicted kinase
MNDMAALIIFGGLPGTGKTTLARMLAEQLGALYLRVDTIEQALRNSQALNGAVYDAGYRVAYAIAAENVRLGRTIIADSVNPLQITRDAWRAVAAGLDAKIFEIEVVCSDAAEHRLRVESRAPDIPGLPMPSWDDVTARKYQNWDRAHFVVDTSGTTVDRALREIKSALQSTN